MPEKHGIFSEPDNLSIKANGKTTSRKSMKYRSFRHTLYKSLTLLTSSDRQQMTDFILQKNLVMTTAFVTKDSTVKKNLPL